MNQVERRTYVERRAWLADYFDRTASEAWVKITSDSPLGRVRRSVRAGRDRMRLKLLNWLPSDLTGMRVLDAGCGTGASAMLLAARGASVVAVDVASTLIDVATERTPPSLGARIEYVVGDMLDESLGIFDYAIAMDSLIHYDREVVVEAMRDLSVRCQRGMVVTVVPRTPLLMVAHLAGRLFPRGDRAPAIQPLPIEGLRDDLGLALGDQWQVHRTERVSVPFYSSQAFSLTRSFAA